MKRLMPIFIVILLSGCGILTAYAPNMLSMIVVAVMGVAFRNYIWTDTGTYIYTGTVNRPEEYTESLGSRGKVGLDHRFTDGPFFQTEENGPVVSGIQGQGKAAAPEWTDRQ